MQIMAALGGAAALHLAAAILLVLASACPARTDPTSPRRFSSERTLLANTVPPPASKPAIQPLVNTSSATKPAGIKPPATKPQQNPPPTVAIPAGFKKATCSKPPGAPTSQDLTFFCHNGPMPSYYDNTPCSKAADWNSKWPNAPDICCAKDTRQMGFGFNGDVDLDKCISKPGTLACSKIKGFEQKICCVKTACKVSA